MKRTEIINKIIQTKDYKNYLEIGLGAGVNFSTINCKNKTGVDPKAYINHGTTFALSSDEFFELNKQQFDCIFIDGLHHEEQVLKDIENALNCLSDNGTIIVHDCNPTTEEMQIVPRIQKVWTGDVWKAWVKLRRTRDDIFQVCIDEDYGCGIITKGNQELFKTKMALTYSNFSRNKKRFLNLVTWAEYESDHLHS